MRTSHALLEDPAQRSREVFASYDVHTLAEGLNPGDGRRVVHAPVQDAQKFSLLVKNMLHSHTPDDGAKSSSSEDAAVEAEEEEIEAAEAFCGKDDSPCSHSANCETQGATSAVRGAVQLHSSLRMSITIAAASAGTVGGALSDSSA
eukprot:CAMPEP_0115148838 /NCGR_PEP_ID=MMETSP0227-20121206/64108_1 /TAXON_ID=89957 /ORGANISM="Polarella glacialis, Strain CCMP 1383" /LENGTH=146 /DNA_ID=CAMNT_0002558941 /DNA_START=516 /DNA_END=957 /DNA_ORIENTATION=-